MSQAKEEFTPRLLAWYYKNGRYGLPWQKNFEWYPRMLSEVMLQQTQVTTVIPKFEAFIKKYPTPEAFACATEDDVMALWAGLGYYSRAKNLLKAIRTVVNDFGGICPSNAKGLAELPGIGPSTAGAIASFVFRERAVMADGNAQRVLSRIFRVQGTTADTIFKKEVWSLAESLLPASDDMPAYTQALMDFGALRCTRSPKCDGCPMADICGARLEGRVADYPAKKKKRERPVKHLAVVFPFSGDDVWLRKKKDKGVWRDLWVPLMAEMDVDFDCDRILQLCGLSEDAIDRRIVMDVLVHDFTHYRVLIHPVAVDVKRDELPTGGLWIASKNDGMVGMPSPISKLLEDIRNYRRMILPFSSI